MHSYVYMYNLFEQKLFGQTGPKISTGNLFTQFVQMHAYLHNYTSIGVLNL